MMLGGRDWGGALLLWLTRVQGVSFSVVSTTGAEFWNNLSVYISAHLVLQSLLPVSCNSVTWCSKSSICAHILQPLSFSLGIGSGHSLKTTICTVVSILTGSVWMEAWEISGAFPAETSFLTVRWVLTIMTETQSTALGCGPTSSLQHPSWMPCLHELLCTMPWPFAYPCHLCSLEPFKSPTVAAGNAQASSAFLARDAAYQLECHSRLVLQVSLVPGTPLVFTKDRKKNLIKQNKQTNKLQDFFVSLMHHGRDLSLIN